MESSVKPRHPGRWQALTTVSLGVTAILGILHLADPFHGDQVLFILGASALDRGEVLYVDFWDVKQPAVFLFYLAAGKLFGFGEVGIHLFELIYLLLFAALLARALRGWLVSRWIAGLAPLATVGAYYALAGILHLTQVEMLVGPPLFATLWLAAVPVRSRRRRALADFLSGVAAGLVVMFKLVFAPIPVAMWAVLATASVRHDHVGFATLLRRRGLPIAAGVVAVLAGVVAWSWSEGSLSGLLWTAFAYPIEAVRASGRGPLSRLPRSMLWFVVHMAPLLLLAGWGLRRRRGGRRRRLDLGLVAWIAAGLCVIAMQVLSWWQYHFLLFVTPVGLLALRGLDALQPALRARLHARRRLATAALALGALVPAAAGLTSRAGSLLALASRPTAAGLTAYQQALCPTYAWVRQDASLLDAPDAVPGSIYVFGTPVYLLLSGRRQAIATQGWAWEGMTERQWRRLPEQLSRAAPAYVYVDRYNAALLGQRSPATIAWLGRSYTRARSTRYGSWYRRVAAREAKTGAHVEPPGSTYR